MSNDEQIEHDTVMAIATWLRTGALHGLQWQRLAQAIEDHRWQT